MFGLKKQLALAIAGLLALGAVPQASAAPIAPAPLAAASSDSTVVLARSVSRGGSRTVVRHHGGGRSVATRSYRGNGNVYRNHSVYRGNGNVYRNRSVYRGNGNVYRGNNYVNRYHGVNNGRWAYDARRYGPRYNYRRSGYNYYRDGYYYSNPWWTAGAGLAVGAVAGAAIASSAAHPVYDDHVGYCMNRYRSYDAGSDTYVSSNGARRRCISP